MRSVREDACKYDPKRARYPYSVIQESWFAEYLDEAVLVMNAWVRRGEFLEQGPERTKPVWMPVQAAPRIVPHTKNSRKTWTRTGLMKLPLALVIANEYKLNKHKPVRVRNWCNNQRILIP